MHTKKILFFSCEPGGAEALIPVIGLLEEHEYDVCVLTYGHAVERFRKNGIAFSEIHPDERDARQLLHDFAPDYVITSATSLPSKDMMEKYLWDAAREAGIGTLAFIDQWQNYSMRFSGIHIHERLRYLPDLINCINKIGRREMIEEGFPEDRLISFGHPYLAGIAARYASLSADTAISVLGITSSDFRREETLVFVSEPLFENFANSRGYNQYDVLNYFLKNVLRFHQEARVVIKLHPKDDPEKFRSVLDRFREIEIHIVRNELTSLECLTLSDRIFGMTSIMLIEAFIFGKTVVSLQPGLSVEDPFVLSRHGFIPKMGDFINFDPFVFECAEPAKFPIDFDELAFLEFIKNSVGA